MFTDTGKSKVSNHVQTKEDYTKTYYNQTVKKQKQREYPERSKKKKQIMYKGVSIRLAMDFSAEL